MDLQLLPSPIAYVRHLVDVEEDNRAKFDQLRVLSQNTLQVVSAILLSDCMRLGLIGNLATQPSAKRLAVGDFATYISEAAGSLMAQVEHSYVPELVQLYGERSKEGKQRRDRLQRIVQNRNRDAHTASLAPSRAWLDELVSEVDAVLEELDCLRSYIMVAARNVEPAPDQLTSILNGLRCQGFSERYVPIRQPISQMVSRSEVILIKVDRSDWLSLRPWLLFFWDGGGGPSGTPEELALLNIVDDRRLTYIGLISGSEYRGDDDWRAFTMYEIETPSVQLSTDDKPDTSDAEWVDSTDMATKELVEDETSILLKRLTNSHENIVARQQPGSSGRDHLLSVRTPVREVAIATVDPQGRVQLFARMLDRAVREGLLEEKRFQTAISDLGEIGGEEADPRGAMLEIGHISERMDWLGNLATCFAS